MPLLFINHPFPDTTFGLWQIAEGEAFFREDLPLSSEEEAELARHQNPLRRLEWLAGRWLLHKLTDAPQRIPLAKDAFSKPFFPNHQNLACSLSHSRGTVGALISTMDRTELMAPYSIGCDIQRLTDKMARIAPKFLNVVEALFVEGHPPAQQMELNHLFWTAKESLYKAYGLKELDFRKHMRVHQIYWDGQSGHGLGIVEKGNFCQEFRLIFSKVTLPDSGELVTAVCVGKEAGSSRSA